jgi:hypothetical protein
MAVESYDGAYSGGARQTLHNDMGSVKKVMKANGRHLAQFQNVMDLVKMITAGDKRLAQLPIQMDLMEEAMMVEG